MQLFDAKARVVPYFKKKYLKEKKKHRIKGHLAAYAVPFGGG
jgi:hypothetical protein